MAARQNAGREAVLTRRIRLLVAATISYNVIEAVVAVSAGTIASSTALIGFGLDSVIEVSSAAAVAWQFSGRDPRAREQRALRLIAVAFFALAVFVTVSAVRSLLGAGEAEHSTVGIILAAVSLVVMPFLSLAQRRAGRELGSRSAVADSRQTLLCTYLSGVLLMGLVLNSTLGWSWADPVAALVIAAAAVKEGLDAWKGEGCCVAASTHAGRGTTTAAPVPAGDAPAAGLLIGTKKAGDGGGDCGCCHDTAVQAATPSEPRHT
ncbi:cation transporter [Pseudarthrobacter phenanthrenivorans]|uniref:Cation transporter n=1 Tax=Pseudarthrobacter phenanthrenivorans TaxID=361575 RepID=A0A3B0FT49_PSEPS|nr:cation transporter [Pseudarthrobacter phenanthrenivorans]RKO21637.1 cation transporter [Pseudarthrobacter phenanthrenivorans]